MSTRPRPSCERVRELIARPPPKRRATFLQLLAHDLRLELRAAKQDLVIERCAAH